MNNLKGAYLLFYSREHHNAKENGIIRKINSQIQTFCNANINMTIIFSNVKLFGKSFKNLNIIQMLGYRLPFINPSIVFTENIKEYDFLYMRRPPFMNSGFLYMLKKIKTEKPSIKIIMEFPTYPYDKEISDFVHYPLLIKDRFARRHLHRYVDRIATLTDDKEIFGIPAIKIKNGYDFRSFPARTPIVKDKSINLCCVAAFMFWHGYERLLHSIHDYYKNTPIEKQRKIIIHFAGEGKGAQNYQKLSEELSVMEHVRFYGKLDNAALQDLYNQVDIGVCSLGCYKKGINVSMELKSREYIAAGLPIVTGIHLDLQDYEEFVPYILEFPNNSNPVDMQKIIDFYDRLKLSSVDETTRIANYLHKTGEKYLNMDAAMKNVVDYVRGEEV